MIPVKICGITNLSDARYAVRVGASAMGYIFYPGSPRFISPKSAGIISEGTDRKIKKVGIFVNESMPHIESIIKTASLDLIQLHGDESDEFCQSLSKPVIRALRLKKGVSVTMEFPNNVCALLLDTWSEKSYGGTGKSFDWSLINNHKWNKPIILSGGVNHKIVKDAIKTINPHALDVNSGVELSPGLKDHNKIDEFFQTVKNTGPYKNIFEATKEELPDDSISADDV